MYAGVGRTTALPGGVKCSMAACRPATTSAIGEIRSGGIVQPYWSACQLAQASAISSATSGVR